MMAKSLATILALGCVFQAGGCALNGAGLAQNFQRALLINTLFGLAK
jgi:hypothetical protein